MRKFLDLYLYNNFHIAFGSVFFCLETYLIFDLLPRSNYLLLLFFGTLIIYSLHRYIGLKGKIDIPTKRVIKIKKFKPLSYSLLIISITTCLYVSFSLDLKTLLLLCTPVILSLLYVFPFLRGKKRLRDLPYIKVFLIAIVWTLLCFIIPRQGMTYTDTILIIERILFMLAITLPFDIRDIKVDSRNGVKTIATEFGEKRTVHLALISLLIGFIILALFYFLSLKPIYFLLRYTFVYLITGYLIFISNSNKQDYHFTGFLDGTLILRGLVFLI